MDCRICGNWRDGDLEKEQNADPAYGCTEYGPGILREEAEKCARFIKRENLFVECRTCKQTVPRICVLFGECTNCTDSDWKCLESCPAQALREGCSHWHRLQKEGKSVAVDDKIVVVRPEDSPPAPSQSAISIAAIYDAHLKSLSKTEGRRKGKR